MKKLIILYTTLLLTGPVFAQQPANADSAKNSYQAFLSALAKRPDSMFVDGAANFIDLFKKLNFVSGIVYFSGNGFVHTQAFTIIGQGIFLESIFPKLVPGSRITFQKCVFKKTDGTRTMPLYKSVFIR